jgi:hypothetical protein
MRRESAFPWRLHAHAGAPMHALATPVVAHRSSCRVLSVAAELSLCIACVREDGRGSAEPGRGFSCHSGGLSRTHRACTHAHARDAHAAADASTANAAVSGAGGTWLDRQDPHRQFWSIYATVMFNGAFLYFLFRYPRTMCLDFRACTTMHSVHGR